jgi:hypothetical protein
MNDVYDGSPHKKGCLGLFPSISDQNKPNRRAIHAPIIQSIISQVAILIVIPAIPFFPRKKKTAATTSNSTDTHHNANAIGRSLFLNNHHKGFRFKYIFRGVAGLQKPQTSYTENRPGNPVGTIVHIYATDTFR